jgi:hypothetical protein
MPWTALHHAVPGTGTIVFVLCRATSVLFRTVLVPSRRARAKWPSISRDGVRLADWREHLVRWGS